MHTRVGLHVHMLLVFKITGIDLSQLCLAFYFLSAIANLISSRLAQFSPDVVCMQPTLVFKKSYDWVCWVHTNIPKYAAKYGFILCTAICTDVGRGGSLVDSTPFVRRVVGSNPALAATYGPWASPSLAVACDASAWNSGLCRERLWVVVDLKRRYKNSLHEWTNMTFYCIGP